MILSFFSHLEYFLCTEFLVDSVSARYLGPVAAKQNKSKSTPLHHSDLTVGMRCLVFTKHGVVHYGPTPPLWSHLSNIFPQVLMQFCKPFFTSTRTSRLSRIFGFVINGNQILLSCVHSDLGLTQQTISYKTFILNCQNDVTHCIKGNNFTTGEIHVYIHRAYLIQGLKS